MSTVLKEEVCFNIAQHLVRNKLAVFLQCFKCLHLNREGSTRQLCLLPATGSKKHFGDMTSTLSSQINVMVSKFPRRLNKIVILSTKSKLINIEYERITVKTQSL